MSKRLSDLTGRQVVVTFEYLRSQPQQGVIIGDPPDGSPIIKLDSGIMVSGAECEWWLVEEGAES